MDILDLLGVALGLAALAGINLYLTVFATSLVVYFGWVTLPPQLDQLAILGDPWVLGVSGVLYFLQFFADKIPWIDSANDAVQTIIRPLGGAVLAVLALGDSPPAVRVIAALVAGGVALTSHTAKASTRLVANTSPEPLSNMGLSFSEDALVLGGLGLIVWQPLVALGVTVVVIAVLLYVLPLLVRSIRAHVWLIGRKLNGPAAGHEVETMQFKLPGRCELALRRAHASTAAIDISVPCLSGGGPRLPRNYLGWLVRFEGETNTLFFVSPRWRGPLVVQIPLHDVAPHRESCFLSEKLSLRNSTTAPHIFHFERGHRAIADHVAASLAPSTVIDPPLELEPVAG